jgi:hypothetical protein
VLFLGFSPHDSIDEHSSLAYCIVIAFLVSNVSFFVNIVIRVFCSVLPLEGAFKCKKKKAKVGGMEEHEGTTATVSGTHIHPWPRNVLQNAAFCPFFVCVR